MVMCCVMQEQIIKLMYYTMHAMHYTQSETRWTLSLSSNKARALSTIFLNYCHTKGMRKK